MKALVGRDIKFEAFLNIYIIIISVLVIISLIVSISSVILYHEFGTSRCFTATSTQQIPHIDEYLGVTNGIIEIGAYSLFWRIEYYLPITEGVIERITINGPISSFGIGEDPVTETVALTICGGETSCSDMEARTCVNEKLASNCGIISGKRSELDLVTPDVPIPGGSTEMGKLTRLLKEHSSLFYINIATTNHPDGAHRSSLEMICRT